MKKRLLSLTMAGLLGISLMACGQAPTAEKEEASSVTQSDSASTDDEEEALTESEEEKASTESENVDASEYASSVENATIDAATYLDYSSGIEEGVYKWVLSEDEDYYVLASVDENGEPIETQEKEINVGANNQERGGMGQGGEAPQGEAPEGAPQGEAPTGEALQGEAPEGAPEGEAPQGAPQGAPEGAPEGAPQGMPSGGMGEGGQKGPGGMGHGGMMRDHGTVYQGVYTSANITNDDLQRMNIYVPADYFEVDEEGNVTGINEDATVGNYTPSTAPIVFSNEFGGWRSSQPKSADTDCIKEGMIYVTVGGRSRDAVDENGNITGKSPTQAVDMKAGIIELRANEDVIPGDKNKIISVGTSGGGQMSSLLGASGNMTEYYEYMYEAGVLGVSQKEDGTYESAYPDHIYAAQAYCPIADIENADLAYAWWWVNLADKGGTYGDGFTEFDIRLQELEAQAFIDYVNSLELKDENGEALTLTGLREGSYYEAILQNVSDALNAKVAAGEIDPKDTYGDYSGWLTLNEDGTYSVTDLDEFMVATGLVNQRNKAVPGFDTMDKSAEGDAFGASQDGVVHFSASVAQLLSDHYEELSTLEGFNADEVDDYIEEALEGESAKLVETQTNLLNATEIMLGNNGLHSVDPARYWRIRSGTADQHTSFSVGYNIGLSAQMLGYDADYHLVWDMVHGSEEGESTGTFIEWIHEIDQ